MLCLNQMVQGDAASVRGSCQGFRPSRLKPSLRRGPVPAPEPPKDTARRTICDGYCLSSPRRRRSVRRSPRFANGCSMRQKEPLSIALALPIGIRSRRSAKSYFDIDNLLNLYHYRNIPIQNSAGHGFITRKRASWLSPNRPPRRRSGPRPYNRFM